LVDPLSALLVCIEKEGNEGLKLQVFDFLILKSNKNRLH